MAGVPRAAPGGWTNIPGFGMVDLGHPMWTNPNQTGMGLIQKQGPANWQNIPGAGLIDLGHPMWTNPNQTGIGLTPTRMPPFGIPQQQRQPQVPHQQPVTNPPQQHMPVFKAPTQQPATSAFMGYQQQQQSQQPQQQQPQQQQQQQQQQQPAPRRLTLPDGNLGVEAGDGNNALMQLLARLGFQ